MRKSLSHMQEKCLQLHASVADNDFFCVSVCTLSVPENSFIVQQTGTRATFGVPLSVECIPGYRLNGSQSNEIVNTNIQCNENGIFDPTPKCEPKGKGHM